MPNEFGTAYAAGRAAPRGPRNPYTPAITRREQLVAALWTAGLESTFPPDRGPDVSTDVEIPFGDVTDDDGIGAYLVDRRRRGLPSV